MSVSRNMESIVLPERVILRLVTSKGEPLRLSNVLFMIRTFAVRKNNLQLGPYASDQNGVVTIAKDELLAEVAAQYDSGIMDYDRFEDIPPTVKIVAMEPTEVENALGARTKVWTKLLKPERQRWASMDDLRNLYRAAANRLVSVQPIITRWDGVSPSYEYTLAATRLPV